MNSRYLIDDVCLWAARVFVGFYLVSLVTVSYWIFGAVAYHRAPINADWFWLSLFSLCILWIVSLLNLHNHLARFFLGITACLYLMLTFWNVIHGWCFGTTFETCFTICALFGFPSMIWITIRPPISSTRPVHV
jgi:hypothetical protein